jgi:hypothetical protein
MKGWFVFQQATLDRKAEHLTQIAEQVTRNNRGAAQQDIVQYFGDNCPFAIIGSQVANVRENVLLKAAPDFSSAVLALPSFSRLPAPMQFPDG